MCADVRIDINANTTQASQGIGNLTSQVDKFNLALGQVDQTARRIFATLADLSERHQRQGFLGQDDQRRLTRGLGGWERESQVLGYRTRGAEARVQAAQALSAGTPADAFRIMQAERARDQLVQRQHAMGILEREVGGLMGGRIPSTPLQASQMEAGLAPTGVGTSGRFSQVLTPLQRAHATLGAPPSAATQRASQQAAQQMQQAQFISLLGQPTPLQQAWLNLQQPPPPVSQQARAQAAQAAQTARQMRQAQFISLLGQPTPLQQAWLNLQQPPTALQQQQARGQAATTAQQMQHAQLISLLGQTPTPLQQAHHQLSTFGTPLQIAHGYQQSLGTAQAQQGLQRAQLISLVAQMGPQAAASGAGGGGGGGVGMGAMGMVGRSLARLPGIAVGYGAYQVLSGGLAEAEQRFRGVLDIGTILQGQYSEVNDTIVRMRDNYQILARDGRAALTTLARATGDVAGGDAAMRVGRAYGFEREAPAMLATLATMGGPTPSLAAMTGIYNQQVFGRAPISLPRFMEAAIDMAGVGGFGARPLGGEDYARTTARMVALGGKYGQHPTEAYASEFAGLQGPTSPLGESLRLTAVGDVARTRRFLDIGDIKNVDMSTWTGQRIAMEQAAQSNVMRESYYRQIARQSGGNEGAAVALTQEMFGITNTADALVRWRGLQREAASPSGFTGEALKMPQELGNIQQNLDNQKADAAAKQGEGLRTRDAGLEKVGETAVIKSFQDITIELGKAIGGSVEAWKATHDPIKTATAAMDQLGQKTYAALSALAAVTGVITGQPWLVGLGVAGASGVALEDLLRPFQRPGSPLETQPGTSPNPRQPMDYPR